MREFHNGDWVPYAETADRLRQVAAHVGESAPVRDFGLGSILAVHIREYVEFLQSAHARWLADGREGDAIGYTFPIRGRRPLELARIDALLGAHSFDVYAQLSRYLLRGPVLRQQFDGGLVSLGIATPSFLVGPHSETDDRSC